ncbi:MAG: UvrD-helicase domain-containing protein [Micrococcales bacterium]|nr:UvrD-helicase domain-containing protein [Micrococcales bacterium]
MEPFRITDPLPTGTVLLEASAGTGKTWTIGALVARFVAEGRATLDELLVVTFSRAATQELRARVRAQLVLVERALAAATPSPGLVADDPGRDELLDLLLSGPEEELAARLERVGAALSDFDAATIATTHQFCHLVLGSLGVAGDTDARATLVEDLDELLLDVVDDIYLRGFVGSSQAPLFSYKDAVRIAREVTSDSPARIEPVDAPPDSPVGRRVGYAVAVRREFDRRKRLRGVLHYNDLLSQLAAALEPDDSPARARMRQRWRVVLVDEFQDTDPVQWQVLDRAFSGHAVMVLIGDPKQAIYAFRGGDVTTYLQAARTAGMRRTLPRNYRADSDLLRAQQALLLGAPLGDDQIVVHRVEGVHPGTRLAHLPAPHPLRLRRVDPARHTAGRKAIADIRAHINRDVARDIARVLASEATFDAEPLRAKDIAVIAYRVNTLHEVQAELRALGVPAVMAGGGSVYHTEAGRSWLALLHGIAAPHRADRARAAALTPFLGYSAADLVRGGDALSDRLSARLRRLAEVLDRRGLAAVVETLTVEGLGARVLAGVGGERTLTDLRHVGQLLHAAARDEGLGVLGLVDFLQAQVADDALESASSRTRRLDTDAAAVQLSTIHGSKGLQFPIVYLPTLGERWAPDPDIPRYHSDPPEEERCLDVGGDGPLWSAHVRKAKEEEAGESLRLLYVALTRAQSQAVLWWAPSSQAPTSALHRLVFGRRPDSIGEAARVRDQVSVPGGDEIEARLQQWEQAGALHVETADLPPVPAQPAREGEPQLAARVFERVIDTDWRRTSYTALSTPADTIATPGVDSEPETPPRQDEPDGPDPVAPDDTDALFPLSDLEPAGPVVAGDLPSPMADLPVGATFGSLVHAALEETDPASPDLRVELEQTVREQLVWWPVELDPAALADALDAVCRTPLGPLAGDATLVDIGRDRLCEMDFELPLSGGDLVRAAHPAAPRPAAPRPAAPGPSALTPSAHLSPNWARSPRGAHADGPTLGDLRPMLERHLPEGDPVRRFAAALADPALADQPLRGYLTGSVDVLLRVPTTGAYLVVDYKTNWLGPFDSDEPLMASAYRPEALDDAMGHSSYPLQALLYAVVAHRYLRWRLPDYDPERHLGGVLYLYVRGMCGPQTPVVDGNPCGVFSWRPPVGLVLELSDLLDGGETP